MAGREGWRSIILDACDLTKLLSFGKEVQGMKFTIVDSLFLPRPAEQSDDPLSDTPIVLFRTLTPETP